MKNIEKYQKIFMETFEVKAEELNEGFVFGEVSMWDSLAHMTLITALEDGFDIMFETEDMIHYHSYLNGMEILKNYGIVFEE